MLKVTVRVLIANGWPHLGRLVRWWRAALDSVLPRRRSYAQHGEDVWLLDALGDAALDTGIYVDVGAYHPSRLSNTYLFYRLGFRGILVEPNPEMTRLLMQFRPRDVVVAAGCDHDVAVKPLFVYSTPADNSFSLARIPRNEIEKGLRRLSTIYAPVLPLDSILAPFEESWIYVLSIDAEGLDHFVLQGASKTLKRTLFVCIECVDTNPDAVRGVATEMTKAEFDLVCTLGWNRIYRNRLDPPALNRKSAL